MLKKINSGGQTGADQGGLEGARLCGIPTGGTAPKGYRTETGPNLKLKTVYGLHEDSSSAYPPRTKKNVRDSDGTLWMGNVGSPGYWCTRSAVTNLELWIENPTPEALRNWIGLYEIEILNVAGNRESKNPGIFERTKHLIVEAFRLQ